MSEKTCSGLIRRLLHPFLIYFGAVGFALAQPVYGWILMRPDVFALGIPQLILLIILFHLVPSVVLVVVRALASRNGWLLDVVICSGTVLSLIRQVQYTYPTSMPLPAEGQAAVLVFLPILVVTVMLRFGREMSSYMLYLGILAFALPVNFVWSYQAKHGPATEVSQERTRGPGDPSRYTVFIFFFDELSLDILTGEGDMIDGEQFPNLRAFAGESLWLRQAMTNYPSTGASIPSALSGQFVSPLVKDLDLNLVTESREPRLITALLEHGYSVRFYSPVFGCSGGRVRCIKYYDGPGLQIVARIAHPVVGELLTGWLSHRLFPGLAAYPLRIEGQMLARLGLDETAEPGTASIVHIMISHSPYVLQADGQPVSTGDFSFASHVDVARVLDRYRGQVKYLDSQFGLFLKGLKDSGAWERSVVIVTADHGTCWRPGCMGRENISVVEPSLVGIPMLVHAPGLQPRILDTDYQHIDFYATVLDVLGLSIISDRVPGHDRSGLRGEIVKRQRLLVAGPATVVEVGLPSARVEISDSKLVPVPPGAASD